MVIIYLMYLSLGGVLILLTYLDLNIPRLSFFYWVKTSCIRIEFVPMRLDILFIWSIYTLKVCRSKPQTLVDIGQHFWYFIPRCFQIGQRSFKWYLMPCRPNQMDLYQTFRVICKIIMPISSESLKYPSCSFFSPFPRTCIWI